MHFCYHIYQSRSQTRSRYLRLHAVADTHAHDFHVRSPSSWAPSSWTVTSAMAMSISASGVPRARAPAFANVLSLYLSVCATFFIGAILSKLSFPAHYGHSIDRLIRPSNSITGTCISIHGLQTQCVPCSDVEAEKLRLKPCDRSLC